MKFSSLVPSVLAASGVALAASSFAPASAFTISQTGTSGGNPSGQPVYTVSDLEQGDTFNLDWLYESTDSQGNPFTLKATGMVTVNSLSSSQLLLDVMVTNNSSPGDEGIRLTSVGFDVSGATGVASGTGGTFLTSSAFGNFPGFGNPLACATSGNNCAGGGGGGITVGATDTFTLDIDGSFNETVTLSDFGLQVQSDLNVNPNSFQLAGTPSAKPVPEPLTILGSATALGIGGLLKREQSKKNKNNKA